MQIIVIEIVFPSGLTISDAASLDDSQRLCVSDRLTQILRVLEKTEAPPVITVSVDGQSLVVQKDADSFSVSNELVVDEDSSTGFFARLLTPFLAPTKDQRQQFGRFLHTISAASLVGAVGFWHSTSAWTASAILNELGLAVAFVVTFYRGMVSMKGE